MLARLPLRLKLTLVFAAAMAFVLVAVGGYLYFRVKGDLDRGINQSLRSRAGATAALARTSPAAVGRESGPLPDPWAQILDRQGRIVATSSGHGTPPLLSTVELRRAEQGPVFVSRTERARLLAVPLTVGSRHLVVVVGTVLKERENSLESLATALLIGGPLLLVVASAASFAVAAAALRPVESMRRRAATISAGEAQARLPLPKARDELHRLGQTLNEMLARLEAALEHERVFVADASHELRTPVAILRTELELALERDDLDAQVRATLVSMAEEADRLSRLADDLLLIARTDQDAFAIADGEVAVADLYERVATRFRARAELEGRRLLVDVDGERVRGDPLRLEQALGNLVDNALRYGAGSVRLSALERDGRVELHVSDSGAGFPPEFLPRAFDRFSRAEPERAEGGGAGLGLAIVAAIARAHRGDARAANLAFGGADAWIALPAAPARA